jgi:hypothetical protein
MNPFPSKHDLIGLFECEPVLLDEGVPWAYNRLTFTSNRPDEQIVCEIEPAAEILRFRWARQGSLVLDFHLNWVCGLEVTMDQGVELLRAAFRSPAIGPLVIQLKPRVFVSFSTPAAPPEDGRHAARPGLRS